jgi:hypothetical protein
MCGSTPIQMHKMAKMACDRLLHTALATAPPAPDGARHIPLCACQALTTAAVVAWKHLVIYREWSATRIKTFKIKNWLER